MKKYSQSENDDSAVGQENMPTTEQTPTAPTLDKPKNAAGVATDGVVRRFGRDALAGLTP